MYKVFDIASREFTAMVVTKAFVFTLVMMPVLMLGGLVLLPILRDVGGAKDRRIIVADASGRLLASIQQAGDQRNEAIRAAATSKSDSGKHPFDSTEFFHFEASSQPELDDSQRLSLSNQIRQGDLYAFVEIPADIADAKSNLRAKFVSQDAVLSGARRWLENHLRNHIRRERLSSLGIDPELVAQANAPVSLEPTAPYKQTEDGKARTKGAADTLAAMFMPFGFMMLMFMVIFMAAQPMLESAMEEKQHRIAELLLGSVSPTELMTGKLLGNVAGSLVIFSFYASGGLIISRHNAWELNLSWSQVPWLIVFQVLGVLFFSSIFLAIGAAVSELKEAQSLLLPVWLVLVFPMMVWLSAVRDPNGIVAVTFSFFPPSAPLMMALRLTTGQSLPWWHAPAAMGLMIAATYVVVLIAGRIYRASLLASDSAASFGKLLQRLRAAE